MAPCVACDVCCRPTFNKSGIMANVFKAAREDVQRFLASGRASIALPFPMGKYLAQVVVPRDMTQDECDRLCQMLQTLVINDRQPNAASLPQNTKD